MAWDELIYRYGSREQLVSTRLAATPATYTVIR